ncbi:unnamed protein product [Protopolystoma xenopodis]|uniref:Uncharacterized protein n=1 Tax=Protopolystoma xenopodis TaxID=117903 RepID=A0A3S5AAR8_9PLAT|nr:unnamed protein product [Protopolystoma xenopodis]
MLTCTTRRPVAWAIRQKHTGPLFTTSWVRSPDLLLSVISHLATKSVWEKSCQSYLVVGAEIDRSGGFITWASEDAIPALQTEAGRTRAGFRSPGHWRPKRRDGKGQIESSARLAKGHTGLKWTDAPNDRHEP